jgi:predicted dehydrogenase
LTDKLRIAVVGMGKMGIVHSCILNVIPDVELTALCEKSSLTRRILKKVFQNVAIVDDVAKMADFNLDAVYVTTPILSHYGVIKALCKENVARNLFVEKTLAANPEEAKELCQLTSNCGGVNMVGYLRRFYVTFKKAKELLLEETVGQVSSFNAFAYSSDFLGLESDMTAARGGVLRDLGCHAVDLALWFFGDLEVYLARPISESDKVDDSVNFKVKNQNGLDGEFCVSWRAEGYRMPEVGFSIVGSKGTITVNDDKVELALQNGRKFAWYRHDLDDNVPFWLALPEYHREDEHFVKSVKDSVTVEPNFVSSSKVDEIISQVEKKAGEQDTPK